MGLKNYFKSLIILTVVIGLFMYPDKAFAEKEVASYTAPDGIKVISLSEKWMNEEQLKGVYDELCANFHGDEIKLLKAVYLYPGENKGDDRVQGEWIGNTITKDGKVQVDDHATIHIYNCDKLNSIVSIAPILSHEYGHHFTFYYYYKSENKTWDQWRETGLAKTREITHNTHISADAEEHKWRIQEIAADDYVQIFGSPKAKIGYDFKDIAEQGDSYNPYEVTFIFNLFNSYPQENFALPLAADLPDLKNYWLEAFGAEADDVFLPVKNTNLRIGDVKLIHSDLPYQYTFKWDKSADIVEYTLIWFAQDEDGEIYASPLKTIKSSEDATAVLGTIKTKSRYLYQTIPAGTNYFILHMRDKNNNMRSSEVLAVDFSDDYKPESVSFKNSASIERNALSPHVKVNGSQMEFEVPPAIIQGRLLVPLRSIFEELGADLVWDQETQTIKGERWGKMISLKIGDKEAFINGQAITLDAPPQIVDGRTLVPLRFVSEALGAGVEWNADLQLAVIEDV